MSHQVTTNLKDVEALLKTPRRPYINANLNDDPLHSKRATIDHHTVYCMVEAFQERFDGRATGDMDTHNKLKLVQHL